jgi:hypothetical protein
MSDPYRHPAGRSCATTAAMLTALAAMLAAITRKAGR